MVDTDTAEAPSVRIVAYVTPTEREALASAAHADDRGVSSFVRVAIREKIEREQRG